MNKIHPGRVLRDLMKTKCVMLPGSFNGLCSRMVSDMGFQGTYLSGAALTASRGVPDIGLLSLESFTQTIEDIYNSSGLPIIADADTGFGEGEMCAKTVFAYNKAGAAGLHLEDQVFPKRCGHLDGKSLIPPEEMIKKIQICAKTRDHCSNGDFIICARTDARGVEGIEWTVKRSQLYIDAGADMIFPEGLETVDEFEFVAKELKKYKPDVFLLANMTEFGKTPLINFKEFERIGYSCVIYPVSTLRIAMGAVQLFLSDLQANGTVEGSLDKMLTRKELYNLLNYQPGVEWHFPGTKSPKKPE